MIACSGQQNAVSKRIPNYFTDQEHYLISPNMMMDQSRDFESSFAEGLTQEFFFHAQGGRRFN